MSTPLDRALRRLVADGTLTADQASVLAETVAAEASHEIRQDFPQRVSGAGSHPGSQVIHEPSPVRPGWTALVAEIGGYVGGSFVLAAAVVLTGPRWGDLGTAARLAVLGVPAVILLAAATAVLATTPGGWPVHHRRGTGPRRRLAAALVLVAGALVGGVAAVAANSTGGWQQTWFFAGVTTVGALGYAVVRTPLLHVATAVAAASLAGTTANRWDGDWPSSDVATGLAVVGVAVLWLALAVTGVLDEAALGLTTAGFLGFVGGEVLAVSGPGSWAGYLVLTVVAVAGLAGYVRTRHVGVLVVGVVTLATVVPQAAVDYTDGAFGAAGALLLTGLSILGASVLGLRLRSGTGAPSTAAP